MILSNYFDHGPNYQLPMVAFVINELRFSALHVSTANNWDLCVNVAFSALKCRFYQSAIIWHGSHEKHN